MPSEHNQHPDSNRCIIGLPSHRALRLLDAMHLPRANHDRLTDEYDALRVATLAISRPLDDETVIVASDLDGFGVGLIAIRHTLTSTESVDSVQRALYHLATCDHDTPPVAAITVLTVLRSGFASPSTNGVQLLQRQLDASGVSLDRWFCLDDRLRNVDVETLDVVPH